MANVVVVNDLGPMSLDGVPIEDLVGSPTQRLLLIALAVEHPRTVSGDRLMELLWPGEVPSKRRLWDNVHRLRRALKINRGNLEIVRAGDAYGFNRSVSLDSRRFQDFIRQAEASVEATPIDAIRLMDEALSLWRGPPLEGYDLEGFAPGLAVRLGDYRVRAVMTRARARLATDDPGTAVGELEELAADHPYDEDLIALLVTALHRSGRRVDALRRLRGFQENLVEQVGLDAGPSLASLEAELLSPSDDTEPRHTSLDASAELPRWRTSFIGRQEVSGRLRSLLGDNRLITVAGPAGVGKTRLAVETSRQLDLTERVIRFVDLAVTSDPASVDTVAAAACGLRDASPRDALIQFLGRSRSVVIVDNCEHLPEAASDLIVQILDRTKDTAVLATSREPLRVGGELVLRLDPLDVETDAGLSSGARLFCERAGLQPSRLSSDDLRLVEDIARRLDGLPLALELAAARANSMSLPDLASDLEHRYHLLTSGERTAHSRHRTLQAAVDWSYDHLAPDQQAVLVRSSTFAGRFTLDDAATVCSDRVLAPSKIRSAVADLVDASLITHAQEALPYRLLETLREYGRNELDATGERTAWARNHAEYFTERARQLAETSYGPTERAVIDELLAQSDDYRTAMQTLRAAGDWENFAELVYGLTATAFSMRGTWPEPVYLVADIALDPPDPVPPRWPALSCTVAALLFNRGLFDEAEQNTALAIRLAPEWFLSWVSGSGAAAHRNPDLAIERGEKAMSLSDPDLPNELLSSLAALTLAKRIAGDLPGALEGGHRLVAESQRFETQRGESIGLLMIARALPNGAPGAAQTARRAFELAQTSLTRVAEVTGAMLHIRHLLGEDLDMAADALAQYLRLPIIHSPPGVRILGAATAYFAMRSDTEFARRLGNLLGQNNVRDFAGFPAVDSLFSQIPAAIDPMTIQPGELQSATTLALERLLG